MPKRRRAMVAGLAALLFILLSFAGSEIHSQSPPQILVEYERGGETETLTDGSVVNISRSGGNATVELTFSLSEAPSGSHGRFGRDIYMTVLVFPAGLAAANPSHRTSLYHTPSRTTSIHWPADDWNHPQHVKLSVADGAPAGRYRLWATAIGSANFHNVEVPEIYIELVECPSLEDLSVVEHLPYVRLQTEGDASYLISPDNQDVSYLISLNRDPCGPVSVTVEGAIVEPPEVPAIVQLNPTWFVMWRDPFELGLAADPQADHEDFSNPMKFEFNPDNWDQTQSVTVRAVKDGCKDRRLGLPTKPPDCNGPVLRDFVATVDSKLPEPVNERISMSYEIVDDPDSADSQEQSGTEIKLLSTRQVSHFSFHFEYSDDGGQTTDDSWIHNPRRVLEIEEGESVDIWLRMLKPPLYPMCIGPRVASIWNGQEIMYDSGSPSLDSEPGCIRFDKLNYERWSKYTLKALYDRDTTDLETWLYFEDYLSWIGSTHTGRPIAVRDNGHASVVTDPNVTDAITLVEGNTQQVEIKLHEAPPVGETVTVTLTSDNAGRLSVSPMSLEFDSDNWNTGQSITLEAIDNADMDGDVEVDLGFEMFGGGTDVRSSRFLAPITATINITDDD